MARNYEIPAHNQDLGLVKATGLAVFDEGNISIPTIRREHIF